MSVNIEGYANQAGVVNGYYQNGKIASPQEKEKDAPQQKADNAVKVSISQEGIESYRNQTREKGMPGRVIAKGNKENIIRQAKQAASALTANAYNIADQIPLETMANYIGVDIDELLDFESSNDKDRIEKCIAHLFTAFIRNLSYSVY